MTRERIEMIADQLERGIDPSGDPDRLRQLKTSELFRVALGAAIAHDEALKDAIRFTCKMRQVLGELSVRLSRGEVQVVVSKLEEANHDLQRENRKLRLRLQRRRKAVRK